MYTKTINETGRKYVELHPEMTLAHLKAVFKDSFLRQFKRLKFICSEAGLAKPLPKGRKPTEQEITVCIIWITENG